MLFQMSASIQDGLAQAQGQNQLPQAHPEGAQQGAQVPQPGALQDPQIAAQLLGPQQGGQAPLPQLPPGQGVDHGNAQLGAAQQPGAVPLHSFFFIRT